MKEQEDMDKYTIKFTEEESNFIESFSQIYMEDGDSYYHIPHFFKKEGKNKYEIIYPDQVPKEVLKIFNGIGAFQQNAPLDNKCTWEQEPEGGHLSDEDQQALNDFDPCNQV